MTRKPATTSKTPCREGKTDKEIRRCVKRYLARRVFRILNAGAQAKKSHEAA